MIDSNEHSFDNYEIYPTIFTSEINIDLNTRSSIQIYNQKGQIIYNQTLNNGHHLITLSNYNAGLYFIFVKSNENYFCKRLIKY